jgi:hypothetical protein
MKLEGLKQLVKEELKRALSEGRQTLPLKDLTLDILKDVAKPVQMTGIDQLNANLPLPTNSMLVLDLNSQFAQRDLDSYKDDLVSQFGADILNASVILDPSEVWYNKIKINDQDFLDAKEGASQRAKEFETN